MSNNWYKAGRSKKNNHDIFPFLCMHVDKHTVTRSKFVSCSYDAVIRWLMGQLFTEVKIQ